MVDYLTDEDVIELHERAMRRLALDPAGLREPRHEWAERLRAMLFAPGAAAWVEGADLIRQAAILAVDLAQAKPFKAGNYLTAFAALAAFLRFNDRVVIDPDRMLGQTLESIVERLDRSAGIDAFEAALRPCVWAK